MSNEFRVITDARLNIALWPSQELLCFIQDVDLYGISIIRVMVKGYGDTWAPDEDDMLFATVSLGGLTPARALRSYKEAIANRIEPVEVVVAGRALQVVSPDHEVQRQLKHAAGLWKAYEKRKNKNEVRSLQRKALAAKKATARQRTETKLGSLGIDPASVVCSNGVCSNSSRPVGDWLRLKGSRKIKRTGQLVGRFQCKACGAYSCFSACTNEYRQHRPDYNDQIVKLAAEGYSQRAMKRKLGCSQRTVEKKYRLLSAQGLIGPKLDGFRKHG